MPRNFGGLPFPPVSLFDENRDYSVQDLAQITEVRPAGCSICVRYPVGQQQRGGYFFHFSPLNADRTEYQLFEFEGKAVAKFSAQALVNFINHCTGRRFDEPSFVLCQTQLNFLKDDEPGA